MSAAREVWRRSTIAVNANDRAQILDALDQEGPVPLRAFDGLVATSRDCEEVVYAMACEGSIDIDLSAGLDDGRAVVSGGLRGMRLRGRS